MPLNWMNTDDLSFNSLLLFEEAQIRWFPAFHLPLPEFAAALGGNPAVEWYLRHKCPSIQPWLEQVLKDHPHGDEDLPASDLRHADELRRADDLRRAEQAVLRCFVDLLVYAMDPAVYDAQPFLNWDSVELTGLTDFSGKVVLDIGSGTGRLAFPAVEAGARAVYAVEPVANLRRFIRAKAAKRDLKNVYAVDGLITAIPFEDGFADVTLGGHVFGDELQAEWDELCRVTRPGGMVILCPGNNDVDNETHRFLVEQGCEWGRFEEPRDGWKRKYWRLRE